MSQRLGITVPFTDQPLWQQADRHRRLVDLGYTDLWSSESNGIDGFTPLVAGAAWAPELRVGTAIAPVFTRGPAVLAQQAAGLASVAPAGSVIGVGASSAVIVRDWNGIDYDRPYAKVRDVTRFLRSALAGERVEHDYETLSATGFQLADPPPTPPSVMIAALGGDMAKLAARESDGVILNWVSPGDVSTIIDSSGAFGEVVARIMVAPIDDPDAVRAFGRRLVTAYLTAPGYAAAQARLGRGERLAPMLAAWRAGDRKEALRLVPDDVVDDLIVHGRPEACRERIAEYSANGVDTPVLALLPVGGSGPEDIDRSLADLATVRASS